MNCPLSQELLVAYWAHDVPEVDAAAIEEHLFSCDTCFEAAGRVAALASGVREALPPVVTEAELDRERARGTPVRLNDFHPGEEKEAVMPRGVDVLIHRLVPGPRRIAERASVEFETRAGAPLFSFPEAPVAADGTVLVACQRHFNVSFPERDMRIRVRGSTAEGEVVETMYTVLHRFE